MYSKIVLKYIDWDQIASALPLTSGRLQHPTHWFRSDCLNKSAKLCPITETTSQSCKRDHRVYPCHVHTTSAFVCHHRWLFWIQIQLIYRSHTHCTARTWARHHYTSALTSTSISTSINLHLGRLYKSVSGKKTQDQIHLGFILPSSVYYRYNMKQDTDKQQFMHWHGTHQHKCAIEWF